MALRNTTAKDLDKFIEDYLLPDTIFRTEVKQAINMICAFLKERCFRGALHPVRVSKVIKGGSSGKGTTLRGRSDADLVVFLTNLRSFQEQVSRRGEFITEIRRQLEDYQTHSSKDMFQVIFNAQNPRRSNPRVLSFELSSRWIPERTVEFDVLPAYDALGQVSTTKPYRPNPQIYEKLIDECTLKQTEGEFSTCFTELQKAFVKERPTKVKSLIRLVKHWYQLCKQNLRSPLPPQYALELLTIYAWESGSGKTSFNTAQGFRTVLELVIEYEQLCIYWTEFYDFTNPTVGDYLSKQLRKPRPVILDPADPTGNLGGKNSERWQRLAQEAEAWLSYPCFTLGDGSSVNSWDPPELRSRWIMTREMGTHSEARPWKPAAHSEGAWVTRPQAGTRGNPEPDFLQHMSAPPAQETWSCTLL